MAETYTNSQLMSMKFEDLTEEKMLEVFQSQIYQMAAGKYRTMSAKAAGGDVEDLVSDLNFTLICSYRECHRRVKDRKEKHDETAFSLTALDAAKFISCRLRNRCLDLSRYQRDHIEPGAYELPDDTINVGMSDTHKETSLRLWRVMLTPLQEQILEVWENNNFELRREPVKALVRGSIKVLKLKPDVIEEAIKTMPPPPFPL
jgi:hypothetical protein